MINEAKALQNDGYTEYSWESLQVALTHAQDILTADNSTIEDYTLTEYMHKLVRQLALFELKGALDRYIDFSKVPACA